MNNKDNCRKNKECKKNSESNVTKLMTIILIKFKRDLLLIFWRVRECRVLNILLASR